ncbi:MAG: hypothetical protein JSU95_07820 [Betaproteobacteria bacterium]|nr:MAG: hypothetical protein JSU95_07820 [Betaproteobacteria bacterium]
MNTALRRTILLSASVLMVSGALAQAQTSEKPEEQVFACLIERAAAIVGDEAGAAKPEPDRLILSYTPAYVEYVEDERPYRVIHKAKLTTSLHYLIQTELYKDFDVNPYWISEREGFDTSLARSELGPRDIKGRYINVLGRYRSHRTGAQVLISGNDEEFSEGKLKKGERIRISIAINNSDTQYVSRGYCEAF